MTVFQTTGTNSELSTFKNPSLPLSLIPIVALLTSLILLIITSGASTVAGYSHYALLGATFLALILAIISGCFDFKRLNSGLRRSASQILPAVPMLICIGVVATTWMLSGVVPTLIVYGLKVLNPTMFLVSTCMACAIVSILTGSSWSTIATIGVAFMGIGSVMGYNPAMTAGAIISGAYCGDKMSPLSDTTVVASSACGVNLFRHIRYMMITTGPSLIIALIVFLILGVISHTNQAVQSSQLATVLSQTFHITPLSLIIPVITVSMIILRAGTILTLCISGLLGLIGIYTIQPSLAATLPSFLHIIWAGATLQTGQALLDRLTATSGISGMLPTIELVLSAMLFGTALMGTGMLDTITNAVTSRLRKRTSIVGSTVATGLLLNSTTADQYLSLIIGGNMYRQIYERFGLEPRLLSRALEDSVSVTSVLIPWNSCGVTQAAVLGVATMTYLPYCIFNYLSPIMSIVMAWTGWKIVETIKIKKHSSDGTIMEINP